MIMQAIRMKAKQVIRVKVLVQVTKIMIATLQLAIKASTMPAVPAKVAAQAAIVARAFSMAAAAPTPEASTNSSTTAHRPARARAVSRRSS